MDKNDQVDLVKFYCSDSRIWTSRSCGFSDKYRYIQTKLYINMSGRGKLCVSLCVRNEGKQEISGSSVDVELHQKNNNIGSVETSFPCTKNDNSDNLQTLIFPEHVTAETDHAALEVENVTESDDEYIPENKGSRSEDEDSGEPLAKKRTRWRKLTPNKWKKNISKENRKMCKPYINKNKAHAAKAPKFVDCTNCRFKCALNFSDENRTTICENYWKLDYCRQKDLILSSVSNSAPKVHRVRTGAGVRKESSRKYHFKKNNESVQVCKSFFLKTLCISHGPIDHALQGVNETGTFGLPERRGKSIPKNKTPDKLIKKVKTHIQSFPTMESHYCRRSSKRLYLDPSLSITKMYDLYLQWCREEKEEHFVSEITYRRTFCKNYNMAFFNPKKDQCEICAQYKNKTITEEDYNKHLRRKDEAINAKNLDKIRATEDSTFLSATFDLQSILQIPSSGVSQMYYSLKLCAYNFTIYEAASPNNAFCFAWTEINGQRGSSEIGTALLKWIKKIPDGIKTISLYSDTCSGQNRNQFIAALFLYVVQHTNIDVIQHNFLEKGHSYMEVDSMHSAIEKAKKNCEIYTMNDLLNVFKLGRSRRVKNKTSNPYYVEELRFSDFLDLKSLASVFLKNRNKDESGNHVMWLKIKVMRYEKTKPGSILFKYNYSDPEFRVLKVFGKGRPADIPKDILPLYNSLLAISEKKKNSLLKLCSNNIIPPEYHAWYKSIPVDKKKTVTIPEPISDLEDSE